MVAFDAQTLGRRLVYVLLFQFKLMAGAAQLRSGVEHLERVATGIHLLVTGIASIRIDRAMCERCGLDAGMTVSGHAPTGGDWGCGLLNLPRGHLGLLARCPYVLSRRRDVPGDYISAASGRPGRLRFCFGRLIARLGAIRRRLD